MSALIEGMKGMVMASSEETARRRSICSGCPEFKVGIVSRCKACGCPIKSKTAMKYSECPLGKWKNS